SIAPRLRGLSSEVDRALDKMEDQHQGHAPKIEALLGVVAEVGRDPSDQDSRRALAGVAADLEVDLEQHLALEEAILFPAVRDMLSRETQTQVMEELRQRRRQNGPHAVATGTGTRSESA
ncbi:MAG: hemerythrin domain-containing protein, partial [Myxococcales bacterium]|nr:hemerythrin domain-containing protein [Myxococcales bacterium]